MQPSEEPPATNPDHALQLLIDGNVRYAAAKPARPNQSVERRSEVAKDQKPWAAVWGCIDSRVPPELVFDRGLGDIFVIRTAGQVIDDAALGSLEFAIESGVQLVMVLGHKNCAVIQATIDTVSQNEQAVGHFAMLLKGVRPAYEKVKSHPGDVVDNVVRANIAMQVERLKANDVLARVLTGNKIKLVGALYDLETGTIELVA